jgi:hypothetical protein
MFFRGKLVLQVLNLLYLRHKKHKRHPYRQEWEDFKTLLQKLVGVIGPDSMDLKLRSTCASVVLQRSAYK